MTSHIPTLTTITVFKGNGSVLVRYDLDGPVPTTNTFLVGIHANSADGATSKQFGIKFLDGKAIALFAFDNNVAHQENFDYVEAVDDPTQILTPYPASVWDELGTEPRLRGYLNYGGDDSQSDVIVEVVA